MDELQCVECHSTFVEETGQAVEAFLEPSSQIPVSTESVGATASSEQQSQSVPPPPSSPLPLDHSVIVQQVLEQVLGIRTAPARTWMSSGGEPSFLPMGGMARPPVVTIVRQTPGDMPAGGIFGLLQSVANIRQGGSFHAEDGALDNQQFEQFLHHILMNENSHSGAPPASSQMISNLPRLTVTAETDLSTLGECCISQEPFEVGDVVISLPCGHNYKEDPITHWLKMHCTCPVCRINIASTSASSSS